MDGGERKQFIVPKKEELIEEIKNLDEEIQHVSLNLIKCDFDANEKDVEKAFPEFKFIKVKKYNPGSFEVIFQMKIDAINFIRNSYDKKILSRRFFIKLGRQHKEVVQDWACVGYVPKHFKNQHYKKDHKGQDHKGQKDEKKNQGGVQQKEEIKAAGEKQVAATENIPAVAKTEVVAQQNQKPVQKPAEKPVEKPRGKEIPKTEDKPKYQKRQHKEHNKQENHEVKTESKKEEKKTLPQKAKVEEKPKANEKPVTAEKPKEQPKKQSPTEEEDEWIVVSKPKGKKR